MYMSESNEDFNQGNIGGYREVLTKLTSIPIFLSREIESKLGRRKDKINKEKGIL